MALGQITEFASLADFLAAFTADVETGTSGGRWKFDAGGSSTSGNTGPGTNNGLSFMHTETSGGALTGVEAAGIAEFAAVPTETGRMLHMRLCIQGVFGDGTEGLEVQQRAGDSDPWAMVALIAGWPYSDSRTTGDVVEDFADDDQTVVASGGWVDFAVSIPDAATQVRLHPRYIQGQGSTWEHDIAFRSFQWEYGDASMASPLDASATLTGGLAGSIVAAAQITGTPAPLLAEAVLTGGLIGSIAAAAQIEPIASGMPAMTAVLTEFTPIKHVAFDTDAFQILLTNNPRQTIILTASLAEPAILTVWWADQVKQWFFDLESQEGQPIVNSRMMVQRSLLIRTLNSIFKGEFYVTGPLSGTIDRDAWISNNYKLYYLKPETVLDLRSKFPWL